MLTYVYHTFSFLLQSTSTSSYPCFPILAMQPLPETLALVEDIVIEYITDMASPLSLLNFYFYIMLRSFTFYEMDFSHRSIKLKKLEVNEENF